MAVDDISDPQDPMAVEKLVTDNRVLALAQCDSHLFAMGRISFQVYSLEGPTSPELMANILPIPGEGITCRDSIVYIAGSDHFFSIVDVSDPNEPYLLWQSPDEESGIDVEVYKHYAYVTSGGAGVMQYDIIDPADARFVNVVNGAVLEEQGAVLPYNGSLAAEGLKVKDGIVYLAATANVVFEIDYSDPIRSRLAWRSDLSTAPWAMNLYVDDEYLHIGSSHFGCRIVRRK